jgi:uncharacterized membrane protein
MKKNLAIPYRVFAFLSFVWCAGIFAAPLLQNAGMDGAAGVFYEAYGRVCHQRSGRSFSCAGRQLGVCIRCMSIYLSFFAGTLAFPFSVRRKSRKMKRRAIPMTEMIPPRTIALICFLPMLLDVVLNMTGISASTAVTRVVTGTLFGSILPWYVVPVFLDGCTRLRVEMIKNKEKQQ